MISIMFLSKILLMNIIFNYSMRFMKCENDIKNFSIADYEGIQF